MHSDNVFRRMRHCNGRVLGIYVLYWVLYWVLYDASWHIPGYIRVNPIAPYRWLAATDAAIGLESSSACNSYISGMCWTLSFPFFGKMTELRNRHPKNMNIPWSISFIDHSRIGCMTLLVNRRQIVTWCHIEFFTPNTAKWDAYSTRGENEASDANPPWIPNLIVKLVFSNNVDS